jgi:hypothetical protein
MSAPLPMIGSGAGQRGHHGSGEADAAVVDDSKPRGS